MHFNDDLLNQNGYSVVVIEGTVHMLCHGVVVDDLGQVRRNANACCSILEKLIAWNQKQKPKVDKFDKLNLIYIWAICAQTEGGWLNVMHKH